LSQLAGLTQLNQRNRMAATPNVPMMIGDIIPSVESHQFEISLTNFSPGLESP